MYSYLNCSWWLLRFTNAQDTNMLFDYQDTNWRCSVSTSRAYYSQALCNAEQPSRIYRSIIPQRIRYRVNVLRSGSLESSWPCSTIETKKWSYDSDSYCTLGGSVLVGRCNRNDKQVFGFRFDIYTTDAKYWREKSTIGYSVGWSISCFSRSLLLNAIQ